VTAATDLAETERVRAFARLVSAQAEIADTVEPEAAHILHTRRDQQLSAYAYGCTAHHHASDSLVPGRLRALLETAARTAGRDLAARANPSRLVTPHFALWVDAGHGDGALAIDPDQWTGPLAGWTAVRLLVAAANGDPHQQVPAIACAEQHFGGTTGLADVLVFLAELAAGLVAKEPTT
jgi:hypothetical protein